MVAFKRKSSGRGHGLLALLVSQLSGLLGAAAWSPGAVLSGPRILGWAGGRARALVRGEGLYPVAPG